MARGHVGGTARVALLALHKPHRPCSAVHNRYQGRCSFRLGIEVEAEMQVKEAYLIPSCGAGMKATSVL